MKSNNLIYGEYAQVLDSFKLFSLQFTDYLVIVITNIICWIIPTQ